ncbi:hypothetical protein Tco_0116725 [Tanacetum coccineum]
MVFNSPCLTDKKELTHHEGTALVYIVPTGKDNFIVSAGRPNMVPAGRTIVSPGSIIFGPGRSTAAPRGGRTGRRTGRGGGRTIETMGKGGGRTVPHLVTPENKRIERVLTDEAIRNRSLRKNTKKRGNSEDPTKDGDYKSNNKRSRTGKAFATTTNPVRKEPDSCSWECFKCGGTYHYKAACPSLNRALGLRENHPNQALAINGGQGRGNNVNPTRGRTFIMGA